MSDKLSDLLNAMQDAFEEQDRYLEKLVDECPYDTKLAVTAWVMKHIVEHAKDGGSYRTLIYDRLGFGPDAYAPLCGHGMTINNEFDLNLKDAVIECLKEGNIENAKRVLGCCDEPGCFKIAGSGWPSENGYRWTCYEHYQGSMRKNDV